MGTDWGQLLPRLNEPFLGAIFPNMGSIAHAFGLGDALFTKTQQKVLGLLFSKSDRSF
jgi:hypothetical protein